MVKDNEHDYEEKVGSFARTVHILIILTIRQISMWQK